MTQERLTVAEYRAIFANMAVKPHKYHAKSRVVDGHLFPSIAEANRYGTLKLLARSGVITNMELQPRFPLMVDGQLVGTYVADFGYIENGRDVVEDVKGVKTPVYLLKMRLFRQLYPAIDFREITKHAARSKNPRRRPNRVRVKSGR